MIRIRAVVGNRGASSDGLEIARKREIISRDYGSEMVRKGHRAISPGFSPNIAGNRPIPTRPRCEP